MKVYFAKSNRANPIDAETIRGALSTLDCEVIQFAGGTYTNEPLLNCDLLIVLPEYINHNMVGKGLASQIQDFKEGGDVLIVREIGEEVKVEILTKIITIDEKNWMNHSAIFTDGEMKDLKEFFTAKTTV